MKILIISLVLLIVQFGSCFASEDFPRIGVMRFGNRTTDYSLGDLQQGDEEVASEYVIIELTNCGKADIVEQTALEPILQEHYLATTGILSRDQLIKVGNLLPVEYLICGNITHVGVKESGMGIQREDLPFGFISGSHTVNVKISAQVMRVKDGKVIMVVTGNGQSTCAAVQASYKGHWASVGTKKVPIESIDNAMEKAAKMAASKIIEAI